MPKPQHAELGRERILAFVPMYNCEKQIGRVLAQFDERVSAHVSELIVVDNRSSDGSVSAAMETMRKGTPKLRVRLLQNDVNYGLGGSHKVAFDYALDQGFDYCVVLHGDDQGNIRDLLPLLADGVHRTHDCLLGARFMPDSQLIGYSRVRTLGNVALNLVYSIAARRRLYDLGSGLNLYATRALRDRFYLRLADDLTFNYTLILASIARRWRMRFFPVSWREDDQISNAKLVRQGFKTLKIVGRFTVSRRTFMDMDHSAGRLGAYSWQLLADMAARVHGGPVA
jgi:dolichol-phosphate mannosyltransferase